MSSDYSSGTPDVGTDFFMAPEMRTKSISSPAMDLWGLGCTLYYMLTGDKPFRSDANSTFYEKIKNRSLNIPKDIAKKYPDAADLIDKLLQVDPRKRLGSSSKDSFTNYQALKSHAFF